MIVFIALAIMIIVIIIILLSVYLAGILDFLLFAFFAQNICHFVRAFLSHFQFVKHFLNFNLFQFINFFKKFL